MKETKVANNSQDVAYENYLADREHRLHQDRESRLEILEAAAFVEGELLAVAVLYLGGGDAKRHALVERLIFEWGGRSAAEKIARLAFELNDELTAEDTTNFNHIKKLVEYRNLVAHGRTETWEANEPDEQDGMLGREIMHRSPKGEHAWKRLQFDEAVVVCRAGRDAALDLSRHLIELTNSTGSKATQPSPEAGTR